MHTTVKVKDLTPRQWDFLQENLLTSYDIAPGVVRVCAEFELTEMVSRHVEMPIRAFAGLMTRLERHDREQAELVQAALTPDALPDTEAGQDPLPGYPDKADDPGLLPDSLGQLMDRS